MTTDKLVLVLLMIALVVTAVVAAFGVGWLLRMLRRRHARCRDCEHHYECSSQGVAQSIVCKDFCWRRVWD